jgi:hypothetical protein
MAQKCKCWGTITALAREYVISRTFIYFLANTLEQTNEIMFGSPKLQNPKNELKLTFSYMLSLRFEGRCSIGSSSTIMKRFVIDLSSEGSISQYVAYFGSIVPDTVNRVNDEMQVVVFASDEIFAKIQPILITVDPLSSAILRIELSDTRKSQDWQNHWDSLIKNGYYPSYIVCDQGIGLCSAKKELLPEVILQTDTYHAIAHLLGHWVIRLEKSAYKAITDEYECEKKLDSARSDQVIDKRIAQFEKAQRLANEKTELYDSFNYLYHCIIGELRIFDSNGKLRDRKTAKENIEAGLNLIETLNNKNLNAASKKVRRALPQLLNYFDIASDVIAKLQQTDINNNELEALCMAWQWNKCVLKAKKSERKRYCAGEEQFWLDYAADYFEDGFDHIKEQVYHELDHIVQSSAIVECINSIVRPYLNNSKNQITQETLNLIMFYHNHRRYKDGKRKKSTPMELLTGKPQKQDWIELLFALVEEKDPSFFSASLRPD